MRIPILNQIILSKKLQKIRCGKISFNKNPYRYIKNRKFGTELLIYFEIRIWKFKNDRIVGLYELKYVGGITYATHKDLVD